MREPNAIPENVDTKRAEVLKKEWAVAPENGADKAIGRVVRWGEGYSGVGLGKNRQGDLVVMGIESGKIKARYVKEADAERLLAPEVRKSLSEWLMESVDKNGVDRSSIPEGWWHMNLSIREASRVLAEARMQPGFEHHDPPISRYVGERVVSWGKEYRVVGIDKKNGKLLLGRAVKDGARVEYAIVKEAKVKGADALAYKERWKSERRHWGKTARKAGDPHLKHQEQPRVYKERYTSVYHNQEARNKQKMGREFYTAGKRIEGSVIQHAPESEIMVVDFEKDEALRGLYDNIMARYESIPEWQRARIELPIFIQEEIMRRFTYNNDVIEAITDGSLAKKLNDPKFMSGLGLAQHPNININVLRQLAGMGKMSDKKIYLGWYANAGVMVCRQMGAAAAAVLERAIRQGRAGDWIGSEIRANKDEDKRSGHLWAVALHSSGREVVFDPAMRYYGYDVHGYWKYRLGYHNHQFGRPGT